MTARRLFFALWPDDRQRERLRKATGPATREIEGDAVDRGNWHVTAKFLGHVPERQIPELLRRAAEIPVAPIRLRFDRIEFWARPKLSVLAATAVPAELESLVRGLETLAADFGIAREDRSFRPHITVARRARPFETRRLDPPVVLEWAGFELVESVPEQGRTRYRPLRAGE